jgi:hypothetical protein
MGIGVGTVNTAEDAMDRFLWDTDMLDLENNCYESFALDEEQLGFLSRANEEDARRMFGWHEQIHGFLKTRQAAGDRHDRRVRFGVTGKHASMFRSEKSGFSDEEEEQDDEAEAQNHFQSESSSKAARSGTNASAPEADGAIPALAATSRRRSGKIRTSLATAALEVPPPGPRARESTFARGTLRTTGTTIAGAGQLEQLTPRRESVANLTAGLDSRRTSVAVPMVTSNPQEKKEKEAALELLAGLAAGATTAVLDEKVARKSEVHNFSRMATHFGTTRGTLALGTVSEEA